MSVKKKTNISDALSLQRAMLLKIGFWPKSDATLIYRAKYICTWCFDLSFQVFLFLELYKSIEHREYKELTAHMAYMSTHVPYLLKRVVMDVFATEMLVLLNSMTNPRFTEYPLRAEEMHVKRSTRTARLFMRGYQISVTFIVILMFITPFLNADDDEFQYSVRFSVFDWGKFRIAFHLYQVICIGMAGYINSTFDVSVVGFMSVGITQFSILKDKLVNARQWAGLSIKEIDDGKVNDDASVDVLIDKELDRKICQYLKDCVGHHVDIIQYCIRMNAIYEFYFLIQFAASVFSICNTWFNLVYEDDPGKLMFLGAYGLALMFQLAMFCLYGNNLLTKSLEIVDACYSSQWYECGGSVRKYLLLIMERAKRPTYLSAGGIRVLGMATYGVLLNSAYSFFALMTQLYGE